MNIMLNTTTSSKVILNKKGGNNGCKFSSYKLREPARPYNSRVLIVLIIKRQQVKMNTRWCDANSDTTAIMIAIITRMIFTCLILSVHCICYITKEPRGLLYPRGSE